MIEESFKKEAKEMEVISNCKVIEKFAKVIRSIMPIICMVGVEVTYKKGRESEI